MADGKNLIFVIDGTFDGLLCALFFGFSHRLTPSQITDETFQLDLFCESVRIETEEARAARVERGLIKKAGSAAFRRLYLAFLCDGEERYLAIYRYACRLLTQGRAALNAISSDDGARVMKLSQFVTNEAHLMVEFLRFSVLENGALFAKFSPKSDCIELVLEHFAKRFSAKELLICDTAHKKVAVFQPPGERIILSVDRLPDPTLCEQEAQYRALWKQFFRSVAIPQRKNPRCQASHLPKRYRIYMTEFL